MYMYISVCPWVEHYSVELRDKLGASFRKCKYFCHCCRVTVNSEPSVAVCRNACHFLVSSDTTTTCQTSESVVNL